MFEQVPVGAHMVPANQSIDVDLYRNVLTEIKEKSNRVRFIMENFPDARNNDSYLCVMYWKLVDGVETVDDIVWATTPEVIRRSRQKIQELGDLMPTREDVLIKRRMNAEIMRQGIQQLH